jgi:hypothetical protein
LRFVWCEYQNVAGGTLYINWYNVGDDPTSWDVQYRIAGGAWSPGTPYSVGPFLRVKSLGYASPHPPNPLQTLEGRVRPVVDGVPGNWVESAAITNEFE